MNARTSTQDSAQASTQTTGSARRTARVWPVDLRSDTVTRPTPEMRRAMAEAEVGDDVYGEDPTVNRLQERAAEIFGREAALFVPSGSMGNLIAIKIWTHHGNEVICEERGHINQYEMAAMSAIAGCMPRTTYVDDGILTWERIEPLIRPNIYYRAQTALISLENSHNMAGGTVYPPAVADDICDRAHAAGIARASGWRAHFQCRRGARTQRRGADAQIRFRDVLPLEGAGRAGRLDAGWLARIHREGARLPQDVRRRHAPGGRPRGRGLIALEKSPARLHEDHANARHLAEGLARLPGINVDLTKVQTNIVIFDVTRHGPHGRRDFAPRSPSAKSWPIPPATLRHAHGHPLRRGPRRHRPRPAALREIVAA